MLILPIKKKWFDMILEEDPSLRKLDEYRERSEYWAKRFLNVLGCKYKGSRPYVEILDEYLIKHGVNGKSKIFVVMFRNGYSGSSPSCIAWVILSVGTGKVEWGAEEGKKYYRLHITRRQRNARG